MIAIASEPSSFSDPLANESFWQQWIQTGNRAFKRGLFHKAQLCYDNALIFATEWLLTACEEQSNQTNMIPMLLISYHNQADLMAAMGQPLKQSELLKQAVSHLTDIANDDTNPQTLRLEASRCLNKAKMDWLMSNNTSADNELSYFQQPRYLN